MAESNGPPDGPYYALVDNNAAKHASMVMVRDRGNIWRSAEHDPSWKNVPQLYDYFTGMGGTNDADAVSISRAEADKLVTSWGGALPS
jgi:hypothetical protein